MAKLAFILGTRPEIIKLYSCIRYCSQNNIDHIVVNTDQHYDANMRDIFFDELGLDRPNYNLNIGSGSHAAQLAHMLIAIEEVLVKERPRVVVVQGDTNTVLAGALVASKLGIKVAHVEAGLRSYDRTMPEEYNRVLTDHCSDYLFAPTKKQGDILKKEGITPSSVYVTGNTIVDAVEEIAAGAQSPSDHQYLLLTCHRPSNTDSPENLAAILGAISNICLMNNIDCLFPVHPRLTSQLSFIKSFKRIKVLEPLSYARLLGAIKGASMVLTDSGGIQEEACVLERKCLILRTNTERPETLEVGGAELLNEVSAAEIKRQYDVLSKKSVTWSNPFGDGKSGARIVEILSKS
jgi:UDP-N-acetylglucosamine 2-epimerase (non-hydrolysing)